MDARYYTDLCLEGLKKVHKRDISKIQKEVYKMIDEADDKSATGECAKEIIVKLSVFLHSK